ncbi:Succinate--CoA ligase [ADP-forming] subunit beta, mitochondrial [Linum perenne]
MLKGRERSAVRILSAGYLNVKLLVMTQINPIAETSDNKLGVADAMLNFDDNAAFHQKELFALRNLTQEDPQELMFSWPTSTVAGNVRNLDALRKTVWRHQMAREHRRNRAKGAESTSTKGILLPAEGRFAEAADKGNTSADDLLLTEDMGVSYLAETVIKVEGIAVHIIAVFERTTALLLLLLPFFWKPMATCFNCALNLLGTYLIITAGFIFLPTTLTMATEEEDPVDEVPILFPQQLVSFHALTTLQLHGMPMLIKTFLFSELIERIALSSLLLAYGEK